MAEVAEAGCCHESATSELRPGARDKSSNEMKPSRRERSADLAYFSDVFRARVKDSASDQE